MVTNDNQTSCGDHFTIYTNTESLGCTPETNIMFYVNQHTHIDRKAFSWLEVNIVNITLNLTYKLNTKQIKTLSKRKINHSVILPTIPTSVITVRLFPGRSRLLRQPPQKFSSMRPSVCLNTSLFHLTTSKNTGPETGRGRQIDTKDRGEGDEEVGLQILLKNM